MWNGAFSPMVKVVSTVRDDKVKPSTNPNKPDKLESPPYPIPSDWDLEVWHGEGKVIWAWQYGGIVYVTINFDHRNECFIGEDVPSNYINYTYLWEENDLEDAQYGEYGDIFE